MLFSCIPVCDLLHSLQSLHIHSLLQCDSIAQFVWKYIICLVLLVSYNTLVFWIALALFLFRQLEKPSKLFAFGHYFQRYFKNWQIIMKLLAWNCQGFRATTTTRRLRRIIKEKQPEVVFLSETLCPVQLSSRFFNSVGLRSIAGIPKAERVVLFWLGLKI